MSTDATPKLQLPYILAAQAQKHVTHNEAIRSLDAVVQLSVISKSLATPPVSPVDGDCYIVAAAPTGAWTGQATRIAAYYDGSWRFVVPAVGWLAWVAADSTLNVYSAGAWADYILGAVSGKNLASIAQLGVNATPDATNRLSVSSPASLFNHVGNGHQAKINKNAAGDTASFLFQTNFSGRAEMGTTGDDDFHFKVSPDGASWFNALLIDRSTGKVTLPNTAGREVLTANRTYFVRTDGNDANTGLANSSGGAKLTIQAAMDAAAKVDFNGFSVVVQVAAGTYTGGVVVKRCVGQTTIASLTFRGDTTTPSNVLVNVAGHCFIADGPGIACLVEGFKLQNSGSTSATLVGARNGATVQVGKNIYGTCSGYQFNAAANGSIECISAYTIDGGARYHFRIEYTGVWVGFGIAVTVTGTPAYSTAFARVSEGAVLIFGGGGSFTGSATGTRYTVELNSVIQTNTANVNFLPGSVAGSAVTGGQYA